MAQNPVHHCTLCEHQHVDFHSGSLCGLTQQKPKFGQTCTSIKLEERLKDKIHDVNLEYEKIRVKRTEVVTHLVIYFIAGLGVLGLGYIMWVGLADMGFISNVPLIIWVIGLGVLGIAFGPFVKWRQELDVARTNKKEVDNILPLYKVRYEFKATFGKKVHGEREVTTHLDVRR